MVEQCVSRPQQHSKANNDIKKLHVLGHTIKAQHSGREINTAICCWQDAIEGSCPANTERLVSKYGRIDDLPAAWLQPPSGPGSA